MVDVTLRVLYQLLDGRPSHEVADISGCEHLLVDVTNTVVDEHRDV